MGAESAGMMSEVKEVQGIALTTISRLVQSAGKEQIQPHLVDLTIAMLESLSGMEVGPCPSWNCFGCPSGKKSLPCHLAHHKR